MEFFPSVFPETRPATFTNLFRPLEQMVNRTWPQFPMLAPRGLAFDLAELPDKYIAKVDLPGIDRKCVDISFEDHTLTVQVEFNKEEEKKEEKKEAFYMLRERFYGNTARSIPLPLADAKANIDAVLKDGVLKIVIPKSLEKHTKRIEIH